MAIRILRGTDRHGHKCPRDDSCEKPLRFCTPKFSNMNRFRMEKGMVSCYNKPVTDRCIIKDACHREAGAQSAVAIRA